MPTIAQAQKKEAEGAGPSTIKITSPATVAANKAFAALSPEARARKQVEWGKAFVGKKGQEYLKIIQQAEEEKKKKEQALLTSLPTMVAATQ